MYVKSLVYVSLIGTIFLSSGVAEARKRHHHYVRHHHIHAHRSERTTPRVIPSVGSNPTDAETEPKFFEEKDAVPFLEVNWTELQKDNQMSFDQLPTPVYVVETQKVVVENKPLPRKAVVGAVVFCAFMLSACTLALLPFKRKQV